jgi:hypothetical protein
VLHRRPQIFDAGNLTFLGIHFLPHSRIYRHNGSPTARQSTNDIWNALKVVTTLLVKEFTWAMSHGVGEYLMRTTRWPSLSNGYVSKC